MTSVKSKNNSMYQDLDVNFEGELMLFFNLLNKNRNVAKELVSVKTDW
jgi:hypothetical protein